MDAPLADAIDGVIEIWRHIQEEVRETGSTAVDPPQTGDIAHQLTNLINGHQEEAEELRASANPITRRALIEENLELEALAWSSSQATAIRGEVWRQREVARLSEAIGNTLTTAITRKSSELTARYVTQELRDSFAEELKAVSGRPPRVQLSPRPGERGVSHYKLELVAPAVGTSIEPVVSEGEFRVIGLAAFLSELSTEPSSSSVILDDPVSSLDIENRGLRCRSPFDTRRGTTGGNFYSRHCLFDFPDGGSQKAQHRNTDIIGFQNTYGRRNDCGRCSMGGTDLPQAGGLL